MHLRLFDYSLSKLCNRQRLPKSHSYCRCRAIWHEWLCWRFLCRILVWPSHSSFSNCSLTSRSHQCLLLGSDICDTSLGVQTGGVTAIDFHREGVQLFSKLGHFAAPCAQTGCHLALSNRSNWGLEPVWHRPHNVRAASRLVWSQVSEYLASVFPVE